MWDVNKMGWWDFCESPFPFQWRELLVKHIGIAAHPEMSLEKPPRCSPKGICIQAACMSDVAHSRPLSLETFLGDPLTENLE